MMAPLGKLVLIQQTVKALKGAEAFAQMTFFQIYCMAKTKDIYNIKATNVIFSCYRCLIYTRGLYYETFYGHNL